MTERHEEVRPVGPEERVGTDRDRGSAAETRDSAFEARPVRLGTRTA